jgi:3-oxoacyl-[acyl-carrier protein] reductase
MSTLAPARPVALVTGASRKVGIAAAIAQALARDGWNVATTFWSPYDSQMPWGDDPADRAWLDAELRAVGAKTLAVEADLSTVTAPAAIFDTVEDGLGPVIALVLCHTLDIEAGILEATVANFDLATAVNIRGSWLLVREYGRRFKGERGRGRIVGITSDHFVGSVAYGASKGALNRIVLAAARELAHLGITANLVEPGPTDTGWMNADQRAEFAGRNPQGRVGRPEDCANVVRFLCSADGQWVNGQVVHSNGGIYSRNW